MLITNKAIVIDRKVNAKDGHVSPCDSGNVSETPPIISLSIIIDEKNIKDNAVLMGDNDEIESLIDMIIVIKIQRRTTKREWNIEIFFAEIKGTVLIIHSANKIPENNEKMRG